jgi:hypothetical protein
MSHGPSKEQLEEVGVGGADLLGQLRLRRDGDGGCSGLRGGEEEREHGVLYM